MYLPRLGDFESNCSVLPDFEFMPASSGETWSKRGGNLAQPSHLPSAPGFPSLTLASPADHLSFGSNSPPLIPPPSHRAMASTLTSSSPPPSPSPSSQPQILPPPPTPNHQPVLDYIETTFNNILSALAHPHLSDSGEGESEPVVSITLNRIVSVKPYYDDDDFARLKWHVESRTVEVRFPGRSRDEAWRFGETRSREQTVFE